MHYPPTNQSSWCYEFVPLLLRQSSLIHVQLWIILRSIIECLDVNVTLFRLAINFCGQGPLIAPPFSPIQVMPRKVNYGVDYDDDYGDAGEFGDDYDYGDDYEELLEDNETKFMSGVTEIKAKQEHLRTEAWLCPICAFDNEDSMSSCYICGVLRNPLRKINSKSCIAADLISSEKEIKTLSQLAAEGTDTSSALVSKGRFSGVNEKQSASGSGNYPDISFGSKNISSLSSESRNTDIINEQKVASIPEYKPETWMIPDKVDDGLSQLNLAIVGHVDSGKSTLSGRLLHLLGQISQKEMHKYEMEAKQQGKGSFAYAWALDESVEERERGITMTVAVAFFKSRRYRVVLLDSPGHRDFVPNMISGATQADAAVLVVDASMGSFEAGLDVNGGQTREHAQLIRSFGVDQLIVAVNKMDVVQYSKERFDAVKHKLGTVLRSCGFKDSSISWIPLSAMENQNLVANPSDVRVSWFKGHFLLDAIDSLQLPARDYVKPLVMPICDVMKSQSQGQVSACGKLESGAIRTGFKVLVMPSRKLATVRSLEHNSQVCEVARAGDNVTVNLHGIEGNRVAAGGVICHPDFPVPVANHLELKILVLDISTPILIGSQLEIHIHRAKEAARVVKILTLLDPKTGKETKKSPRCLLAKQNAVVEVILQESICVDEYSNRRALGRVSLRALGRTIALGVVTQIIKRGE